MPAKMLLAILKVKKKTWLALSNNYFIFFTYNHVSNSRLEFLEFHT